MQRCEAKTNFTRQGLLFRGVLVLLTMGLLGSSVADSARAQSLAAKRLRNGSAVRRAFRSIVAEPSRWTVRIFSGEKPVAFGLIVDENGYVLTKASELDGELTCRVKGTGKLAAEIVGIHSATDLALLKIEGKDLPVAAWLEGDDPPVGGWLATPGLDALPVAIGVVSVARRAIERRPGVMGISVADDDDGPRITKVFSNSGAEHAGLKIGDIIVEVDGSAIENSDSLTGLIKAHPPGDSLMVEVLRGDEAHSLRVVLGDVMDTFFERGALQNRMGGELSARRNGFPVVLQHDTFLKPAECGGPIVDLTGRVVGINIARAGRTESYAIPASEVLPLLEDLKAGKYAPKALEPPQHAVIGPPAEPDATMK